MSRAQLALPRLVTGMEVPMAKVYYKPASQLRPCASCGTEFLPVRRDQEHCSKRCRMHEYDRRRYGRTEGPPEPAECAACGDVMPGRYPFRQRRCEPCSQGTCSAVPWTDCAACGVAFIRKVGAPTTRYCSAECRPLPYLPVGGTPVRATCDHCGDAFDAIRSQGRYRCEPCRDATHRESRRLSKRRRARRKRAAGIQDRYTDVEIFDRDDWTCGICGGRIVRQPVPHPKAPTIDHIVPLAAGGADTRANVQAAHFLCNSRKGDRAANDQLRLLG